MAKKRRRSLVSSPTQRFRMWDAKVEPESYREYLTSVKDFAREKMMAYQADYQNVLNIVKSIVNKYGIETHLIQEYMWYALKLYKLVNTYRDKALQDEADAWFLYYLVRGRVEQLLREIAMSFGINISSTKDILKRVGVSALTPFTYAYTSDQVVVTNTSKELKAEARTTKEFLDPVNVKVSYNNPSGSGASLFIELSLLYSDGSESVFRSFSVGEGVSDVFSILNEDIYEDVLDDKKVVGVRLYAYVSVTPPSGYEPVVQLMVYGKEFG